MTSNLTPEPVLEPGRNCWRVENAARAAFIVDAENFFRAAKAAMLRAQHSILIIGWDFHPRVRLEPGGATVAPEMPNIMYELFEELLRTRPELEIRVLKWDLSLLFAPARRIAPAFIRNWRSGPRLHFRLDTCHPVGACLHQKLLIIDDSLAFCGGIDFSGNRWDTRAHRDEEPDRRRPIGRRYPPIHDLMMALEGDAAAALGELARERWRRVTGECLRPAPRSGERWPEDLLPTPDFRDVSVGIARTAPAYGDDPQIREVESLYLDAIAAARRTIFIENQYLLPTSVVEALAARLEEPDGPEVVIVTAERSSGWLEQQTMDVARDLAVARLREADRHGRLGIYSPLTTTGGEIHIHSKTMVLDDRLARIGSANLNRRSMGFDLECDIAVEAPEGAAGDEVRRAILNYRDDLLAEHLGVVPETVAGAVAESGGLLAAVEAVRARHGAAARRLAPLPAARATGLGAMAQNSITDPDAPEPRASWWKLLGRWRLGFGSDPAF